jgi:predicted DNA-binding transcriptional regulator YafY
LRFCLDFEPIKIYGFFMESHRLARLLRMIVEVRAQPQKPPERIAKDLGVSIRQFYYDRNQLARMGFQFSRVKGRFTILSDPVVTVDKVPLSEILALVLATRHLFATRDFSLVRRALKGLYTIVDHMEESQQELLRPLIQDVIVKDGFGCRPDILEDMMCAVDEKRRILVHFRHGAPERQIALDPLRLSLRQSRLFLEAYVVAKKRQARFQVGTIDRIVFTPFFRPEYTNNH